MEEINKYENGKIYKICSFQTDEVYIGSTTKKYLRQRLNQHKTDYKKFKEGRTQNQITSFKILEYDDADIILLENYPYVNRINAQQGFQPLRYVTMVHACSRLLCRRLFEGKIKMKTQSGFYTIIQTF